MFDSQFANIYAIVAVIGIIYILWIVISKWQLSSVNEAHLLSESQENMTGIAAFLLAGASVALSIGFAISLSFHPILTFVFVMMFTGIVFVEFNSSFHLARAWKQRRIGAVFFSLFQMIGGVLISILAGQSLLQIAEATAQAERLKQNAEYEAFMERRENANQRVDELAITESEVMAATLALQKLTPEQERLQAKLDNCPHNYYKNCIDPTTAKLNAVNQKMAVHAAIVKQGHDYELARKVANELNSTSIDAVPGITKASPGIEALGLVLRANSELVGAYIFLLLAIFCELSALISFFFWGQSRHERAYAVNDGYTHNVYDMQGNDIHSDMIERNNEVLAQITQNLDMLLKEQQKIASTHNVLSEPKPIETSVEGTSTHNVLNDSTHNVLSKTAPKSSESSSKPIETSVEGTSTHNVLSKSENGSKNGSEPIDYTHNVLNESDDENPPTKPEPENPLMPIFKKIEADIKDGNMTNPSFKNLQKMYQVTQTQAGNIRDMLLKARIVVKDKTGMLIPIPGERT